MHLGLAVVLSGKDFDAGVIGRLALIPPRPFARYHHRVESDEHAEVVETALRLWGGVEGSARLVGEGANRVYRFEEAGRTRYLRLVSEGERTRGEVGAELDFVAHLRRGGASVVLPIASAGGRLVEEVRGPRGLLFASAFEEARGERFVYVPGEAAEEHFRLRGRTLGQIHALSKGYVPPAGVRRFAWDEDVLLAGVDGFLPAGEKVVRREYETLRERLESLPKFSETYGLTHGDFGETNFRCAGAQLNVFDFDDCSYHWFAYDLAVTIYPHGWRPEALRLLTCLLEGYAEHTPTDLTPADIKTFCRWRLVYMFLVYARKWGFEKLSARQAEWFARRRENIARGYEWGAAA